LLDQARAEHLPGQAVATAAAGLVTDPVQVRADRADADEQLAAIWALVRPWATRMTSSRSRALSLAGPGGGTCCEGGAVSIRAYSAAVSRLITVPCSSAIRVRSAPSG
jgi:hypothetical protein